MNILTKICVVLLLVASLIASVVFISMATVGPNWRNRYDTLKKQHNTQKKGIAEANRSLHDSNNTVTALRKQIIAIEAKSKDKIDLLNSQIAGLKKDKDAQAAVAGDNNLKLASINKSLALNIKLVENLRKELAEARKIQNEKAARVAHLVEQLNDEKARGGRLSKNLRGALTSNEDLKRTITSLNTKLQTMEKMTGKSADDLAHGTAPATRVTGTISDVSDNLASINVGSAHGLKAGMKLIVYRGSKFVGWIKLEQVAADEAAGVMVDKQCEPLRGDQVTSSLE